MIKINSLLRLDVLKKNLEIVKLQDAQKGKEPRSVLTEFSTESSTCRSSSSSPERKKAQVSLTGLNFNMERSLETNDVEQKKEIEDLKSKLKAVSILVSVWTLSWNYCRTCCWLSDFMVKGKHLFKENEMHLSCVAAVLQFCQSPLFLFMLACRVTSLFANAYRITVKRL